MFEKIKSPRKNERQYSDKSANVTLLFGGKKSARMLHRSERRLASFFILVVNNQTEHMLL